MSIPESIATRLRLPVIGSPMLRISNPELVIAQCTGGIVGAFPALNARSSAELDEWLHRISEEVGAWEKANSGRAAAPVAVNHIVHKSNIRLDKDLEITTKWRVPLVVTSLGARTEVFEEVRSYGGSTFHDVINNRFARKAAEMGADGLILVAAGAGGYAGTNSPFAIVGEVRSWFEGPIVLGGAIASGSAVLAAQVMGADMAYIGSRFIPTLEAGADDAYKRMIVGCDAADIVYSNVVTGIHANYLKPSFAAAGLDPLDAGAASSSTMDLSKGANSRPKAWKDIWGCGQGIGGIQRIQPTREVIDDLFDQYSIASRRMQHLRGFARQ